MKVAIIHYWLSGMRGGEYVLENILDIFPEADIFTHVFVPDRISHKIKNQKIYTTFIDSMPFASKHYPKYLMLMPSALELLNLEGYDLVISSESGPAKGVITAPDVPHFCYCHSPMRYLWDRYHEYRAGLKPISRFVFDRTAHRMRIWDSTSANRVDHFVANSNFVSKRIEKYYRRSSTVIHPPVALDRFSAAEGKGDYYLYVSELVPYKRADLALGAFSKLDRRLLIVGDGPERKKLEFGAPKNIEFRGRVTDQELATLYQGARALVFPGVEDFGIVPLEAMACARPVIAFSGGGARDTVVSGTTGLFFNEPTVDALVEAVERFESDYEKSFDRDAIVRHASMFSPANFRKNFVNYLHACEPGLGLVPEETTPSVS